MSTGEVRRVSREDIQLVQNLIERCLQLYMNQNEVVATLLDQAKIEPGFTELVWKKLEEENQEFFKAYRLRLMVKQQIIVFNKLLERQVEMMRQSCPSGVFPNGSNVPPVHMTAAHYGAARRAETMHHQVNSSLPNAFSNGGSLMRSGMQASADVYSHNREINQPAELLSNQSSNIGGYQGINGVMIKSDPGYGGSSPFIFGGDGSVLDMRPSLGETSVAPLGGMMVHDLPLPDVDTSSFGFLGQIPRNFSLSDLTADFSQSSDILESYPKSPFLTSDSDNLMESNQGDDKRLDTISEGLSYEDFGSD